MHNDEICPKYHETALPDEQGNCSLCGAELVSVISTYTVQQGVEDGTLVEIFKNRWSQLSGGKPIIATSHVYTNIPLAGLLKIWNAFVVWRKEILPTLPEEEQLFVSKINNETVWLIEDGSAFTILYPDDY